MGKVHGQLAEGLSLYVRQMAWLNAVPKPSPGTKRAELAAQGKLPPPLSRIEQLKADKTEPVMPPNPAPLIINRLIEIGLTDVAGMGAVPLGWGTILHWSQVTGIRLPPWEARLLRRLSTEYLAEGRRAEAEGCPPPWAAPITQAELDADEARTRALLG